LKQPIDFTLRRRQELPQQAFLPFEQDRVLLGNGQVAALSYR
jgi:hypothetical protein